MIEKKSKLKKSYQYWLAIEEKKNDSDRGFESASASALGVVGGGVLFGEGGFSWSPATGVSSVARRREPRVLVGAEMYAR